MRNKKILILAVLIIVATLGVLGAYNKLINKKLHYDDLNLYKSSSDSKLLKQSNITLYFMTSDMSLQTQEQANLREVLDEVEKRTKDTLNIHIEIKYLWYKWDDFIRNIRTMAASNEPCDGFGYIDSGTNKNVLSSLYQEGLILDLTKLFPRYAPGYYSKFTREDISFASSGGKLLCVPNKTDLSKRRCAIVREDFLKKYGISGINDYDDFENFWEAVRRNDPGITPLSINESAISLFAEESGYAVIDERLGALYPLKDDAMKVQAWEETPEFKTSVARIRNWFKKGFAGKDLPDEKTITSGMYASFTGSTGTAHDYNTILDMRGISDFRYVEFPLYVRNISARNSPADMGLVLLSKTGNAEALLKLIEWLNQSQENYDLFMYGIEGKHYKLSGSKFSFPKNIKVNAPSDLYYFLPHRKYFMDIDYERSNINDPTDFKADLIKLYDKASRYPPHQGFNLAESPVSQESEKYIEIRGYSYNSIEKSLRNNTFNEGKVQEFLDSQKNSGMDKAMEEIQKKLDHWKNNKEHN